MDSVKVILGDNKDNEHEALMIVCPDCGYSSFHLFVIEEVAPVSGMVKNINHLQCTHCSRFFCQDGCNHMPTEFGQRFADGLRAFATREELDDASSS